MTRNELKSCLKFMYQRWKSADTKVMADCTAGEAAAMIEHVTGAEISLDRAVICMEAAAQDEPAENIIKIARAMYVGQKDGVLLPVEELEVEYEGDHNLKSWCKSETAEAEASKSSFDFYIVDRPGTWTVGAEYGRIGSGSKYLVYKVGAYLCADLIATETRLGKMVRKYT